MPSFSGIIHRAEPLWKIPPGTVAALTTRVAVRGTQAGGPSVRPRLLRLSLQRYTVPGSVGRCAVAPQASDAPELGFQLGDHVCAFYNGGGNFLDDIVVDFLSRGLQAGNKCICFMDSPASVQSRIPGEFVQRDDMLQFFTAEQGYLPEGDFSKDAMIRNLDATARGVLSDGYKRLWLIGDTTVIVRNAVDLKTWFATETEVSELAPRYPQFIMCTYNLDLYDGEMVMYVLKTHTKIFVNGLIIANPYYIPKNQFLGSI
jgi:hypothetical protein